MKDVKQAARDYMSYGLNPLPISKLEKVPLNKEHNTVKITDQDIEDYPFESIGISTGLISGSIEAIDFDLKNAPNPREVWQGFKAKLPKDLMSKMVVQRTVSGGFHLVYRCEEITSSKKLAKNSQGLAVIETRGEGGLIKCYPSEGYEMVQGDFSNIQTIKPHERVTIFAAAKMLSKTTLKDASKRMRSEDRKKFDKFPEYNNDIDTGIALLEKHGWTIWSEDDVWVNLTRPNKKEGISAGYNKEGKFLYVFTSSQDNFEEERPYNNHAIFAELECEGRYDKAYAKLYEDGYGIEETEGSKSKEKDVEEDWEDKLQSLSFLSDDVEENGYLEQARKGEISLGLSTGFSALDKYMRLKPNSVNIGLGYDGVGKSVGMLTIAAASSILHGWKWGMIMPENKTGMSRRRLIETVTGKTIDSFKGSPIMFDKYKQESRNSFNIISNKKHYSIRDVIEMGKRLYEDKGIDALLIDPFNFFKVEGNAYSYNNDILSELRVFAEEYCAVYIMAHPNSNAPRNNIDEYGYLSPPKKYEIQGGADYAYRVDDFFIWHRVVNHSDNDVRRTMQFIMEKVKEVETGGRVHSKDDFTGLIYEERDGFLGYWDENGDNPMYAALKSKEVIRSKIKGVSPSEAFDLPEEPADTFDEPF
tara:strand:+ start:168 stop:2099 length:1932 start_codon:yes stop_codon:yes gene_type:complete